MKAGDIVKGLPESDRHYSITNSKMIRGIVSYVFDNDSIIVLVIEHKENKSGSYHVRAGYFEAIGYEPALLPDGLTVGGSLDLRGTKITALPDGLTVGGSLDLRGTKIKNKNNYRKLCDGDHKEGCYVYADGILIHVREKKAFGEYTFYAGKIKGRNVITDGKLWAYCKDVRSGIMDLRFKASDRDKSAFEGLTPDSRISFEDAAVMYRIITGVCSAGVSRFIEGLEEVKESYTVKEICEITSDAYGGKEFAKFFEINGKAGGEK